MLGDVALINWQGNDYTGGTLIDVPPAEQAQQIAAAKELSLGLLYWLQTEVTARRRWPTVIPSCGCAPTSWGLPTASPSTPTSASPGALKRTRLLSSKRSPLRISPMRAPLLLATASAWVGTPSTSTGKLLTWCTPRPPSPSRSRWVRSCRGILDNLLAACKNIGTTHITNGCYRLHPVEVEYRRGRWCVGRFLLGPATDPSGRVQQRDSCAVSTSRPCWRLEYRCIGMRTCRLSIRPLRLCRCWPWRGYGRAAPIICASIQTPWLMHLMSICSLRVCHRILQAAIP